MRVRVKDFMNLLVLRSRKKNRDGTDKKDAKGRFEYMTWSSVQGEVLRMGLGLVSEAALCQHPTDIVSCMSSPRRDSVSPNCK